MSEPSVSRPGPFLLAAFFCERLLTESTGVRSAIRILDRLTVGITPGVDPSVTVAALVMFGSVPSGTYRCTISVSGPAGGMAVDPASFTETFAVMHPRWIMSFDVVLSLLGGGGPFLLNVALDGRFLAHASLELVSVGEDTRGLQH